MLNEMMPARHELARLQGGVADRAPDAAWSSQFIAGLSRQGVGG